MGYHFYMKLMYFCLVKALSVFIVTHCIGPVWIQEFCKCVKLSYVCDLFTCYLLFSCVPDLQFCSQLRM